MAQAATLWEKGTDAKRVKKGTATIWEYVSMDVPKGSTKCLKNISEGTGEHTRCQKGQKRGKGYQKGWRPPSAAVTLCVFLVPSRMFMVLFLLTLLAPCVFAGCLEKAFGTCLVTPFFCWYIRYTSLWCCLIMDTSHSTLKARET